MRSRIIEDLKRKISLTPRQRSLLVGKLLGDGHLESQNHGRTYRLKVEHSVRQKEYVYWLYEELKNLVNDKPYTKTRNTRLVSYGFNTYSLGSLRFYAQQFYQGKKKIIPKLISKLLDDQALAVWFMDDGSFKSNRHRTYIIHTLGYKREDLLRAKDALGKKFGIQVVLHRQRDKWRLYVNSNSAERFKQIVSPYVVESLKYKLGNTLPKE